MARYSRRVSDYQYPDDEFDAADAEGPVPVGVHRAQVPAWRSWIPLLAVLIIVPLVAWGAVALLRNGGGSPSSNGSSSAGATTAGPTASNPEPEETETPEPQPSGDADMTMGVTVHNGTNVTGLAGRTGDKLTNAGFTSVQVAQGVYDSADPSATTVFYSTPDNAATAKAVADALGTTNVVESAEAVEADDSPNPIVVVLRDDYDDQG